MIRRDLFYAAEYDSAVENWVIIAIARTRDEAIRLGKALMNPFTHRRSIKVGHPSQKEVDLWVLVGNKIDG